MEFSYILLKIDKLQGITHKILPLRNMVKVLGEIYMIATTKIFNPTKC